MDSYIKHDNFVLVNNVLKEYNEMKKEVKNSEMLWNVYIKTMETYWTSFENNTVNKNSSVRRPKQNRLMFVSNCAACGNKLRKNSKIKSRFLKNQEPSSIQQF